jgi:hypothetical protein
MTEEVVAAIIQGPDPAFPTLPAGVFLAVTEFTLIDEHHWRPDPRYGEVLVSRFVEGSEMNRGRTWDTLEGATGGLEEEKARLRLEGWVELPVEPLKDPE